MHIFLTGNIQVGKSTLIRNVLTRFPEIEPGGFRTVTVADIPGATGSVYIIDASDREGSYQDENRVGIRRGPGLGATAFPNAFDARGVAILEGAERRKLILRDEIGKMEASAVLFCARVKALLDGDTPILGVVRQEGQTSLQTAVRSHPKVRLITVTENNRDDLADQVAAMLRRELNRRVDSAGAFVFRDSHGTPEVLMIRCRLGWAFPKGHLEPGETEEQAAIREIREETGIEAVLRPGFHFATGSGLPDENRKIHYFLGEAVGGCLTHQPEEILDAAWIPAAEAEERIRFPEDVPAFRAAFRIRRESH